MYLKTVIESQNKKTCVKFLYTIRSSPCDHSRKQPALVKPTFAKPHLNSDFIMKSSRKLFCYFVIANSYFVIDLVTLKS